MKKNVHVTHHKDLNNWHVMYEGETTPRAMFDTKEEAVKNGREMAMESGVELLIHNKDGVIRDKRSYGHDPHNVRG